MELRLSAGRFAPWLLLATLSVSSALAAAAQEDDQLGWSGEAEANANLFFGNTEQLVAATRGSVERADSALELSADGRLTYAEAAVTDGPREVTQRSWQLGAGADWNPFATFSPFLLGNLESSLQKRIDLRYSAGAGGKYTWVRTEEREASFSLALLGERTNFAVGPAGVADAEAESVLRWSARVRGRYEPDERLKLTHSTFYRPRVTAFGEYTISSASSAAYQLTELLSATLSFVDDYDSEARSRGARSNNDGQLLFGLLASF